jgi:YVTN family beta-propeller protein
VTGVIARVFMSGNATAFGAAMLGNTTAYITRFDGVVDRLSISGQNSLGTIPVGTLPTSIAINTAGTRAFVGNQDGPSLSTIDLSTNTVINTLTLTRSVMSVGVIPGDSLLLLGIDNGVLYIKRLPALTLIDSIILPSFGLGIAFRGDTTAFVSSPNSGTVTEINLKTHTVTRTINTGGVPQGVLVSPSGTELYLANEIGQFQVWNLTTGTLAGSVNLPGGGGFGIARNPANGLIYVSTSYIGARVLVIDPVARTLVRSILTGGTARRIAFTANGTVGVVANEGGWVDFIK